MPPRAVQDRLARRAGIAGVGIPAAERLVVGIENAVAVGVEGVTAVGEGWAFAGADAVGDADAVGAADVVVRGEALAVVATFGGALIGGRGRVG